MSEGSARVKLLDDFENWFKETDPTGEVFDLIDIDYEYPQKQPDESAGFISFLKALRVKFPDKEISVAVSGLPSDGGYAKLGYWHWHWLTKMWYVSSGRHDPIQLRHRQPSVHASRPSLVSD